ncbi:MAG: NAD(P)-dependent oxidoreductase [Lactovum sp.]
MMKIGFIGTGVMGNSMAGHLKTAGHELYIYNRTESKTKELVKKGAEVCATVKEVAEKSAVIFSIVGYPQDVSEIYFGENGIFEADIKGKILIDQTTSEPELAIEIYKKAEEKGAKAIDAPVSGGDLGAKNASLTIMVGGDLSTYKEILGLLEKMGKTVQYQGPAGSGQHTKMANQIAIAGGMTAMVELLAYAEAAHLNVEKVLETVSAGSASSWSLLNYAPRILAEDYSPGFFVKHFIKDLGIALSEAEKMNLKLPATQQAKKLYDLLAEKGFENDGTQALMKLYWPEGKKPSR